MKRALFLLPLILLTAALQGCHSGNSKKTSSAKEAQKKANPFRKAAYVEFVSFNTSGKGTYYLLSKSNYIDAGQFTEKHILSPEEQQKLIAIFDERGPDVSNLSDCYSPKHAILLYGNDSLAYGFVELAFLCKGYKTSDGLKLSGISQRQWIELETLFREAGLKKGFAGS